MKKYTRTTGTARHASTAPLAPQDLARAIGGGTGDAIGKDLTAQPHGIQGSGRT
jgi:hypothetical protein